MKRLFTRMLVIMGAVSLFTFVLFFVVNVVFFLKRPTVPEKTILELHLDKEIVEYVPEESVALAIFEESPRLVELLESIERAAGDERVKAIVANVGGARMGLAKIQEIRDAVKAFRQTGKKAYAFADTMGEFGQGTGAYYLASAFDEIFIQPSGSICITGFMAETPFVKGTLEKLGVVPRFDSRAEYKNAMNTFTENHYTQPHAEAVNAVLTSFFDKMVGDVSSDRGLEERKLRELFDKGLFSAAEAIGEKLVDRLLYRDEVLDLLEKEFGADAMRVQWSQYLDRAGSPYSGEKTIAVVYGVGAVQRGESGFSPMSGESAMGSETVTKAFREAMEDESVSAVVFRIDSPGGSYVASDTIWRETLRAKQEGLPVIASMGDVAGSGGYFIAMSADKIVAQPGTVTGSIGVFAGKMITSELWEKLGVTWDDIKTSENASFWTGTQDYTPEQWALFQRWLDRIYEDFTTKAAQGRGLSKEEILAAAKGRIWSGEDAVELGLVDELGGFKDAIRLAKQAAGIPADENVTLKEFPARKSMLEILLEKFPVAGGLRQAASSDVAVDAIKAFRPYMKVLSRMGLTGEENVLSMPRGVDPVF